MVFCVTCSYLSLMVFPHGSISLLHMFGIICPFPKFWFSFFWDLLSIAHCLSYRFLDSNNLDSPDILRIYISMHVIALVGVSTQLG